MMDNPEMLLRILSAGCGLAIFVHFVCMTAFVTQRKDWPWWRKDVPGLVALSGLTILVSAVRGNVELMIYADAIGTAMLTGFSILMWTLGAKYSEL